MISTKLFKNTEQLSGFICQRIGRPGRKRGFAFVEMGAESEESAAIEALDGAEWMGRTLRVNKAKPRENRKSF